MPEDLKSQVKQILLTHRGRDNPIKAMEIAKLLGFKGDRPIRLVIRELRKEEAILANTGNPPGYFIADTLAELEEFRFTSKSRCIEEAVMCRDVTTAFFRNNQKSVQVKLI